MSHVAIVRDLGLNYPALYEPKAPFGTMQWEVQVETDCPEKQKELEALGIKTRVVEGKIVANVKRKTVSSKGEALERPKVVDNEKEPMDPALIKKIGNGSRGAIKVFCYEWKNGARSGISSMLTDVMVTDMVEYEGSSETEEF